jgi:hypothetical protein
MADKHKIEGDERKWFDKVVALLEADKKAQWVIGDALLEGEKWLVKGISGKDLHADASARNHAQKGAEDEKTPWQASLGGYNPYEAVAEETGYDKGTLLEFCRVARTFSANKRVMEVSWSHHQAVASDGLSDKKRQDLLEQAANQKLSLSALRTRVRAITGDEMATAGYQQLSFKLPQADVTKLEKIAKREKRKLASLMEQAVDLLFQHFSEKQKKAA